MHCEGGDKAQSQNAVEIRMRKIVAVSLSYCSFLILLCVAWLSQLLTLMKEVLWCGWKQKHTKCSKLFASTDFPASISNLLSLFSDSIVSRGSLTKYNFSVKMALVNFSRVALTKLTNKSCLGAVGSVRNHWNKDFKPAPFPQTQKEREAAAKKYAMPADKYEPYADDGLGYGDYPKLPNKSVDLRDPYYPYDYPEFRRNFNDPMHVETDMYSEDRYSTGKQVESVNV